MNLAWIAAVLRPFDVALHPNFRDDEIGSEVALVASVISGDIWRQNQVTSYSGDEQSGQRFPTLEAIQNSFTRERQEAGVRVLASELLTGRPRDPARSCALALIACSSAAELDDYDTCFSVLEHQLRWVRRGRSADHRLIEAILTQQLCLRRRDTGQSYEDESIRVVRLLTDFDVSRCSKFQLGPGVSWSSTVTLEQIVRAVYSAALSLLPLTQPTKAMRDIEGFPTWQDRVRNPPAERLLQIAANESDTYEKYVSRIFVERYQGQARTIFAGESPDLFWATFQLELLAHGDVYGARRELAQLRFLQAETQIQREALDEVPRLFRHAAAARELDMALRSLREAGPLEALSKDARRILSNRTQPNQLRSVELAVLTAAAELLTPAEARPALDTVRALLHSGGPIDLPGHQQATALRLESAWLAAVSLAHAAGQSTYIARELLAAVSAVNNADELLDRAFAQAANNLHWGDVDEQGTLAWQRWIENSDTLVPITREIVQEKFDRSDLFAVSDDPDLHQTAQALNAILRGAPVDRSSLDSSITPVLRSLAEIRAEASRGHFNMGGISAADVAAGLILYDDRNELWPDLVEFLTDNRVARDDRVPALERLSRDASELPTSVQDRFSRESEALLHTDDRMFFDAIDPFPSALRLLGLFECITEEEAFDLAAELAASSRLRKRREAGRTLAVWSRRLTPSWLASLAIQLSHDDDVQVRAHTAQALARLAITGGPFEQLALRRLLELLNQDGLVIPLLALRILKELRTPLPASVIDAVKNLQELHPSLDVRLSAGAVVESATRQNGEAGPAGTVPVPEL